MTVLAESVPFRVVDGKCLCGGDHDLSVVAYDKNRVLCLVCHRQGKVLGMAKMESVEWWTLKLTLENAPSP